MVLGARLLLGLALLAALLAVVLQLYRLRKPVRSLLLLLPKFSTGLPVSLRLDIACFLLSNVWKLPLCLQLIRNSGSEIARKISWLLVAISTRCSQLQLRRFLVKLMICP